MQSMKQAKYVHILLHKHDGEATKEANTKKQKASQQKSRSQGAQLCLLSSIVLNIFSSMILNHSNNATSPPFVPLGLGWEYALSTNQIIQKLELPYRFNLFKYLHEVAYLVACTVDSSYTHCEVVLLGFHKVK